MHRVFWSLGETLLMGIQDAVLYWKLIMDFYNCFTTFDSNILPCQKKCKYFVMTRNHMIIQGIWQIWDDCNKKELIVVWKVIKELSFWSNSRKIDLLSFCNKDMFTRKIIIWSLSMFWFMIFISQFYWKLLQWKMNVSWT